MTPSIVSRSRVGRTAALLLSAAVAAATLTGCWDRREVNDIAIVSGTAMDKVGDKYRAAVQFPLAGQLGGPGGGGGGTTGKKSWYVDSGTGETVKEANNQLQRSMSRQLYFSHRRVLIMGEEMARGGISSAMDITMRTSQNRMSAFVVVAKGEAIDLLNADAVVEQQPSEMMRELAVNSMKSPRTIRHVADILLSEGVDVALPYFVSEKIRAGAKGESKTTITAEGLAAFHKDKLAGFLKGDAAKGALWAMNQARRPSVTVQAPKGEGMLTVLFSENEVELDPAVSGDEVTVTVKIRAIGFISDNESNYPYHSDLLSDLKQALAVKIIGNVEKGVKQLQEYGSDACGFGDTLYRKHPGDWKRLKDRWPELYPKVQTKVKVELQIEHSGSLVEPAAKKEEELVR